MNTSFQDLLSRALKRNGYQTLLSFYQAHPFSFTYEYLRRMSLGEIVPKDEKIEELATALGIDSQRLYKAAQEFRFEKTLKRYYRQPNATHRAQAADKVHTYGQAAKRDAKIHRLLEQLSDEQKDEVIEYIRFLKRQWRKQNKNKTTS